MSYVSFLASEFPLNDVHNTHIKLFSVNEALEKGINIPKLVLESSEIDRNKPGVILWVDSEENLGEITIKKAEKAFFTDDDGNLPATNLPHFSSLEWRFTEKRAVKLIEYIREHLKKSNELEIWHIWIGHDESKSEPEKRSIHINELTPAVFEDIFVKGYYNCMAVKRT